VPSRDFSAVWLKPLDGLRGGVPHPPWGEALVEPETPRGGRCYGPRCTDIPLPPNAMLSRSILAAVGSVGELAVLESALDKVTVDCTFG